jgi:glycosyltransferase involved in cell wall biosynthesis
VNQYRDLSVLHIGAGRYSPEDRAHVTYGIWSELASGFGSYQVLARSRDAPADWVDGNLRVTLIGSRMNAEAEFLFTQFKAVPHGLRSKPDVIVCQSPVLGGLAALIIARLTGARILMELHGMEFFAPARFGSRWWLLQRLSRFALKRADRIRVLSPSMGEAVARLYGADLALRTRSLPPRVDVSRFVATERRRRPGDPLRAVMVATVVENKGQLRLIRALTDAPFAVELHIVGAGPDLAAVKETAQALATGTSKLRVVAHGSLSHAAVADVLRLCDVFVFYSAYEAAGRAMMEAMAVGLPVITTDAGFCVDLLEHGREGFILGPDPDHEIVPVLNGLRENPELAQRMGTAGRERAEREYASDKLFKQYRELIVEAAGDRASR